MIFDKRHPSPHESWLYYTVICLPMQGRGDGLIRPWRDIFVWFIGTNHSKFKIQDKYGTLNKTDSIP